MSAAINAIFREVYQSQLGQFELRLQTTNTLFRVEIEANRFRTVGHTVEVRKITIPPELLPMDMQVETATAWLFYITKHNTSGELLTFSMELHSEDNIQGQVTTGQYIWAMEFENGIRQLHIGTEDEDAMAQRARANDWMPPRLAPLLGNDLVEIARIVPDKRRMLTHVPQLQAGEQFYFHYILAENPYHESVDYPGETDIATWTAVGQSKHRLEKFWQEQTKKLQP